MFKNGKRIKYFEAEWYLTQTDLTTFIYGSLVTNIKLSLERLVSLFTHRMSVDETLMEIIDKFDYLLLHLE